ncbi:MAG: hypothetical protein V1762_02385 [Nitrospirota bacterium]
MSYWFGLTLEKYAVLVSDRRRIDYEHGSSVDDSHPKIHKINDSIYITGSGLLPFIEEVAKNFREMFGAHRPSLKILRNSYLELQGTLLKKYQWYHNQVLKQLKEKKLDTSEQERQCTSVVIGAVTEENVPLLLVSHSVGSFKVREQSGGGKFVCTPPLDDSLLEMTNAIKDLIGIAGKALNRTGISSSEIKEKASELLPSVIQGVASRISSVSPNGDIAIIGYDASWEIEFQ